MKTMYNCAKSRKIYIFKGIDVIVHGVVTERGQQSTFSDYILNILVLIGNVPNKDDDLTTQILHLSTFLNIFLGVAE